MKKILFVINTLGTGGAENSLIELIKKLDSQKYDIYLYVLLNQGELRKKLPEYVKLLNETYDDAPVYSPIGKENISKLVRKSLFCRFGFIKQFSYIASNFFDMQSKSRISPDKLMWKTVAYGAQRFNEHFDLAVAFLEGGSAYYVSKFVNADVKAAFMHIDYSEAGYTKKLDGDCYYGFDKIYAVSKAVKDSFLRVYPDLVGKVKILENSLDREAIERLADEGEGFTDDFDGIRILSIGRLTKQKSLEVSIEAMKILRDYKINARWYVLGEGNCRKELEKKLKKMGLSEDFLLPGNKENPYPYLKQCDLYVHASRYEGKSVAIKEAKICKRPIIATDCPGNMEQITDGYDGILCKFSPEDIAGKIISLINNRFLSEKLSENAGISILKDFSNPDFADEITTILQ